MNFPCPVFDVAGRKACVTGASSGVGRALAEGLARAGAAVVGVARRTAELNAWRDACRGEGLNADAMQADIGTPESAAAAAEAVIQKFGAPDILINAAGVNPRKPAADVSPDDWRRTIDLNLSAPFFMARAFAPAMCEKKWGRIINIASLQSERALPNGAPYGASKGGVAQLTRAMAEAWSADGVTCNALAPGFFPTELTAPVFNDPAAAAKTAAQTCIGRNGILDDLIGPMLFFASAASDYVTGQVLFVDGGFTAK